MVDIAARDMAVCLAREGIFLENPLFAHAYGFHSVLEIDDSMPPNQCSNIS
jgi:hypothetical protein